MAYPVNPRPRAPTLDANKLVPPIPELPAECLTEEELALAIDKLLDAKFYKEPKK